jgi:hypothetical protein
MKQPVPVDEDDPTAPLEIETQEIPYPELPPGAEYLVSFFHSAGIATQTGMGLIPLSWQEIQAFVRCNAHEGYITPWELSVIRKMSEAYCAEYARASDKLRKAPYTPEVDVSEVDRAAIADKVKNALAAFKREK